MTMQSYEESGMGAVRLANDVQAELGERVEQFGGHVRLGREVGERGGGGDPELRGRAELVARGEADDAVGALHEHAGQLAPLVVAAADPAALVDAPDA